MEFQYETIGNASYLIAVFESGKGLINYQLQMLINNDIKNIIKAHKRQKNEDVLVSYNITSKIALAQLDTMNKIPKHGLIKIIEGALAALEDIEEYQLVSSGIIFDEEYIFVKPGSFEPSFIYVPNSLEDSGIEPLKKFILSLIMGSKVEIANDNFVQVLLETLNNPALTTNDLKKLCQKYKSSKAEPSKVTEVRSEPRVNTQPQPAVSQPPVSPVAPQPTPAQPEVHKPTPPSPIPSKPPVLNKNPKKVMAAKSTDKSTEGSNKSAKIKFIVFQVIFAAVIIGLIVSGVLFDASGSLQVQYAGAVALGIACSEFILYRELFVNNKSGNSEEKKVKASKKPEAKKVGMPIPGKEAPVRPSMPGKDTPKPPVSTAVNAAPPTQQVEPQTIPQPVQIPVAQPIPQPTYVASPQMPQYGQMPEFETEDTVVLDDANSEGAYLEYYENGLMTKIKLSKESIVIGKLRGQCDFAINNNKISKIHAEFITRGTDYFVKDYNSTNGTYINGSNQRIASNAEYQIFNGDRITLANVDMTFRC